MVGKVALDTVDGFVVIGAELTKFGGTITDLFLDVGHGRNITRL